MPGLFAWPAVKPDRYGGPGLARHFKDPIAVAVHSLLLVTSMVQFAVLPLLPTIQEDLGLSSTTVSLLLALPTLTMVFAAVPVGALTDRVGPKQVTRIAASMLTVSCVLQTLPGLAFFSVGRLLFGLAMTAIWTSGPAWLSESRSGSSGKVGAVVTSGAAGSIVGPLVAGLLADRFGIGTSFALFAVVSACLAVPLVVSQGSPRRVRAAPAGWSSVTSQIAGSPALLAALAAMIAVGAGSGAIQLLVPLQLHRSGESASVLGAALSVAGLVYVVASALTARASSSVVTGRAVGLGCVALGLVVGPAVVTVDAAWMVACLLLSSVPRAQLNTTSYRLAAVSQVGRTGSLGVVIGLLNLVWAIGISLGPIVVAWITDGPGIRFAFLATAAWPIVSGAALLVGLRWQRRCSAIDEVAPAPVPLAAQTSDHSPVGRRS